VGKITSFHSVVAVLLKELDGIVDNIIDLLVVNINLEDRLTKLPLTISDKISPRTWRCHYTQKIPSYLFRKKGFDYNVEESLK
jgi:hypothetical protein